MKTTVSFLLATFYCIVVHAQPVLDWSKLYGGGSNATDKIVAICVDNNCNTFVTGQSDSIGRGVDIVTIKYDGAGNIIWRNRWDGIDHLDDIPTAMQIDNNGNVYVCGMTEGLSTGFNYVVVKYASNGTIPTPWPVMYNNHFNQNDIPNDLAVSPTNGDVYVTGSVENQSSVQSLFTIRYSSSGTLLDSVNVSSFQSLSGRKVKVDNSGNVFVLYNNAGHGVLLAKYSSSLVLLNSPFQNILDGQFTNVPDMELDASGNVYFCYDRFTNGPAITIDKNGSNA